MKLVLYDQKKVANLTCYGKQSENIFETTHRIKSWKEFSIPGGKFRTLTTSAIVKL